MAARPLYLGTDVLQRARDLEFRQRADRDIWKLGFDHQAESDITGLSKLIEPPPLELQAAPEQEPLPIVVSDRPDALALQRQAQERQAPQQSMMQPAQQQQAPAAASGAPVAMPQQTATRTPAGAQAFDEQIGDIVEGDPDGYFRTAGAYARQVERETGIPAALSLAVSANETGYGQRRYMAGSNNYHGIQALPGEEGAAPYRDWRPDGQGGQAFYDAAQRSFASPLDGFRGFARFLLDNPRYQPALARYRETGDVEQLAADIHAAGYAEDPAYTRKIVSIMRGIPEPTGVGEVVDRRGVPLAQRPGMTTPPQAEQTPAAQAQAFAAGSWTPNQIEAATAEGLDYETALAVCGPAAAIAFARKNGRNPTMQEALALAREVGWTVAAGMAGPASQQKLLERMGIASRLVDGTPDWQAVATDVQRGNPVTISTPGHYFVAERYDPESGMFDFGQSAKVLKASGGRTWFRPEELVNLGMGDARAALFIDNPESPTPSIAAGEMSRVSLNAAPADAPGRAAPPAPAGVSSAPAGAPPAPWEMAGANLREGTQTDANSLMLKENDGEDVGSFPTSARQIGNTGADSNLLPGDGGTPPTPEYDPRTRIHSNVVQAFLRVNGRMPTPAEVAEFEMMGYGVSR